MGFGGGIPVLLLVGGIVVIGFVVSDFMGCRIGYFCGFELVGYLDLYIYRLLL